VETLNLGSVPGMKETIVEGLNTPLSECLGEDEVSLWCIVHVTIFDYIIRNGPK